MSILDMARSLTNQVLTSSAAANTSVLFTSPGDTPVTATIMCLAVKTHNRIDQTTGISVNGKTARVTVSEAALVAADYPVRNSDNEVDLNGHLVTWSDSSGTSWTYEISEWKPDETLGNILCILEDFEVEE